MSSSSGDNIGRNLFDARQLLNEVRIQSNDPGAIGPGQAWLDTTDPSNAVWKIRNLSDSGWLFSAAISISSIVVGPPGIGEEGEEGQDSIIPGKQGLPGISITGPPGIGEEGEEGQDSLIPGPTGPVGLAGRNQIIVYDGEEGEEGQDSLIPGPQGATGDPGAKGSDALEFVLQESIFYPDELNLMIHLIQGEFNVS